MIATIEAKLLECVTLIRQVNNLPNNGAICSRVVAGLIWRK